MYEDATRLSWNFSFTASQCHGSATEHVDRPTSVRFVRQYSSSVRSCDAAPPSAVYLHDYFSPIDSCSYAMIRFDSPAPPPPPAATARDFFSSTPRNLLTIRWRMTALLRSQAAPARELNETGRVAVYDQANGFASRLCCVCKRFCELISTRLQTEK